MTNTEFILREKSGGKNFPLAPAHRFGETHLSKRDGALVLAFVAAFIGLVLLLAK